MADIVVAEDDADIRAITLRLLQRAGHGVRAAADGRQAWQLIGQQRPDIVVTDIDMPVMSGVELCQAIRADPATRDLPVVFVSGSLVPDDERPVRAQATAVLQKSSAGRHLVACVDKALRTGHEPGQQPFTCP